MSERDLHLHHAVRRGLERPAAGRDVRAFAVGGVTCVVSWQPVECVAPAGAEGAASPQHDVRVRLRQGERVVERSIHCPDLRGLAPRVEHHVRAFLADGNARRRRREHVSTPRGLGVPGVPVSISIAARDRGSVAQVDRPPVAQVDRPSVAQVDRPPVAQVDRGSLAPTCRLHGERELVSTGTPALPGRES